MGLSTAAGAGVIAAIIIAGIAATGAVAACWLRNQRRMMKVKSIQVHDGTADPFAEKGEGEFHRNESPRTPAPVKVKHESNDEIRVTRDPSTEPQLRHQSTSGIAQGAALTTLPGVFRSSLSVAGRGTADLSPTQLVDTVVHPTKEAQKPGVLLTIPMSPVSSSSSSSYSAENLLHSLPLPMSGMGSSSSPHHSQLHSSHQYQQDEVSQGRRRSSATSQAIRSARRISVGPTLRDGEPNSARQEIRTTNYFQNNQNITGAGEALQFTGSQDQSSAQAVRSHPPRASRSLLPTPDQSRDPSRDQSRNPSPGQSRPDSPQNSRLKSSIHPSQSQHYVFESSQPTQPRNRADTDTHSTTHTNTAAGAASGAVANDNHSMIRFHGARDSVFSNAGAGAAQAGDYDFHDSDSVSVHIHESVVGTWAGTGAGAGAGAGNGLAAVTESDNSGEIERPTDASTGSFAHAHADAAADVGATSPSASASVFIPILQRQPTSRFILPPLFKSKKKE